MLVLSGLLVDRGECTLHDRSQRRHTYHTIFQKLFWFVCSFLWTVISTSCLRTACIVRTQTRSLPTVRWTRFCCAAWDPQILFKSRSNQPKSFDHVILSLFCMKTKDFFKKRKKDKKRNVKEIAVVGREACRFCRENQVYRADNIDHLFVCFYFCRS